MFKKKNKKEQGVLLLEETDLPRPALDSSPAPQPSSHSHQPQNRQDQPSSTALTPSTDQKDTVNEGNNAAQEDAVQGQSDLLKRSKNPQLLYIEDALWNGQNEPKRMDRENLGPSRSRRGLTSSTLGKKAQVEKQVHEAFGDIGFEAGSNLIKDMDLPEEELEEEAAKRRFLQNVEQTRLIKEGKMNNKVYRGMNGYANYKLTGDEIKNAAEAYKKKMGPSRLNSTIKNTCRFDYVQNLCKDWHDSGYCPFGNSCLYLHDRSTVKTGWELEKDFEQQERERWKRINNPELAKKEDRQKLIASVEKYRPPSDCPACQQPLKAPVEVECSHIFCSRCALTMVKCKSCGRSLSGIMNNATEKLAKMSKDYEQMVAKLEVEQEESLQKRRRFENTSSLDVFAD